MPRYRRLPLDVLFIDKDYQRNMDEQRILRMAEKYDPDRIGHLDVSDRGDGSFAVMDGQHRLLMAEVLELKDLPCDVFDFIDQGRKEGVPTSGLLEYARHCEAEHFDTQGDERRAPRPYHEFRSRAFRGAEPQSTIHRIVTESGMRIGQGTKPGVISAVRSLIRIYERHGEEALATTLRLASNAWRDAGVGVPGLLLEGLAVWVERHEGHFNEKDLCHRLSAHEPDVIVGRSKARAARLRESGNGPEFVADEITRIRNMRRRRLVA